MSDPRKGGHPKLLQQQTALAQFGELALRSDDLDKVLTEACRLVSEALATDLAKVVELQEDGETLLVRAGVGWKAGVVGVVTVKATDNTSEGHAIRTGEPVISPDIAEETRFRYPAFLTENGVRAIANVLILGGHGRLPFGILQIDSREPRQFTRDDITFLRSYANLIAAAVNRLGIITEVRDAEARLRASEERLQAAFAIKTVGVMFWGSDFRLTEVNDAFLRMTGFSREEALGKSWQELTPLEFHPLSLQAIAELATTGETTPFEKQYYRKDGSRWWGLFAARKIKEEAVEFVLDVTDRKAAEQAVRDGEARLRSIIEGIPPFVFRSRSSGERMWGSSQWIAYSGLSEEESLGLGWLDAIHPGDQAATMAAWAAAEERGLFTVEHRTRRAMDGAYRWFQSRATPVRDERGRIVEWFGTSSDIDDQMRAREVLTRSHEELEALVAERTGRLEHALETLRIEVLERRQAEETLRQAQKMEAVGQLTGGIAHDFNNMLQGIAAGLEMARRRMMDGRTGDAVRYLDMARESMRRAAGLTRRLLAFARRQRLDPTALDPDGLIAGIADLIRRTMGPGIKVELNLRESLGSVLCDANELESTLLNLCINAHDAMPGGGRLTISTGDAELSAQDIAEQEGITPGSYVEISVEDTGQGMPPDVLERAFEPFFTTKPLGQGTGLGLSQVYGFVRQSGGLVRLESAQGRGTTVRLLLPRHERLATAKEQPSVPVPERTGVGRTVLLVDDEDTARRPAAERLRELGYRVLEAVDGPAALHLLDGGADIDMLVTDVGLPNGMNGRQVAEAVRERRPGLPMLFITGYAGTELPPDGEVIDKPFDLDTLARRVQAAFAMG